MWEERERTRREGREGRTIVGEEGGVLNDDLAGRNVDGRGR